MQGLRAAARHARVVCERGVVEFFDDGCPQRAAAVSYYALFSLFPLAILTVAVLGLVLDEERVRREVIGFVLDNLPLRADRGRAELGALLRGVTRQVEGFGIIGLLGLLFAASGVMGAIRHALNAAWDVSDDRPPVIGKLIDLVLVAGFGLLAAASFGLSLVERLATTVTDDLQALGSVGGAVAQVLLAAGGLGPAVLDFVVFAALFRLVPAADVRVRDVWPGALAAAVGVGVAKLGFALYLKTVADYGAVYASLGTVIAFMVFVFVAANVLLLGAEIASEWPRARTAGADEQGDDTPLGRRLLGALRGLFVRPERRP